MAKFTIWVDRSAIASNRVLGAPNLPTLRVRGPDGLHRAREVSIKGPSQVRYDIAGGGKCGASVWVETDAEVEMIK